MGLPCLLLYLNSSVMLGNYLQQTTSADVIFQMHFFLGTLRVNFYTDLKIIFIFCNKIQCGSFIMLYLGSIGTYPVISESHKGTILQNINFYTGLKIIFILCNEIQCSSFIMLYFGSIGTDPVISDIFKNEYHRKMTILWSFSCDIPLLIFIWGPQHQIIVIMRCVRKGLHCFTHSQTYSEPVGIHRN